MLDAVFLDRDGTLIEDPGYLSNPADVVLLPGAADALRALNEAGIPAIVITNQSGIGRGYYSESDFRAVQVELERQLAAHGARLDDVYFCPHDPDRQVCACRKPGTALFVQAAREHGLRLHRCLFIGDRERDVVPGEELGAHATLRGESRLPPGGETVESAISGGGICLGFGHELAGVAGSIPRRDRR
jgi:D-glycero-D-manno-heptose 1,7-bisphosphate phosphatase